MLRFIALLALAAVAYGESDVLDDAGRIVGGDVANIADVPYQLSLRRNAAHHCGATLISDSWAVSAAHCTFRQAVTFFALLAGTPRHFSGGQSRGVAEVIHHPEYDARTTDNDISLLRTASPFDLGTNTQPARLPNQGASVATGTYGLVSGWGTIREGGILPNLLAQVWLPVLDQDRCNASYAGAITSNMFCAGYWAGGRDACHGDSGGPFVSNGELIGVVSWGIGCARPNYPGVYARVSVYRNWIAANTGV